MKSKIIIRDKGWKAAKIAITDAGSQRASAGIFAEDGEVVQRAIVNEFGTRPTIGADGVERQRIPARSFIRSTLDEETGTITEMETNAIGRVIDRKATAKAELLKIAQYMAERIRVKIDSGVLPENAPSTVRKKGHGDTLRDSREMRKAVKAKIEKVRD